MEVTVGPVRAKTENVGRVGSGKKSTSNFPGPGRGHPTSTSFSGSVGSKAAAHTSPKSVRATVSSLPAPVRTSNPKFAATRASVCQSSSVAGSWGSSHRACTSAINSAPVVPVTSRTITPGFGRPLWYAPLVCLLLPTTPR